MYLEIYVGNAVLSVPSENSGSMHEFSAVHAASRTDRWGQRSLRSFYERDGAIRKILPSMHCITISMSLRGAKRRGNLIRDFSNNLQEIATSWSNAPLLAMTYKLLRRDEGFDLHFHSLWGMKIMVSIPSSCCHTHYRFKSTGILPASLNRWILPRPNKLSTGQFVTPAAPGPAFRIRHPC